MRFFAVLLFLPTFIWGNTPESNAQSLGVFSLIPPILAIVLAFLTKRVYLSLFLGIWSGTLLLFVPQGLQLADLFHSFEKILTTIVSTLSDSWNITIIAQLISISGLIALISKNGGAYAVAEAISKKAKSARSAQLFTCFTALFIFFDDYANCLITGPVMRPVTDKLRVSREKLSFIIDATAAPIAGVALISTWIGYELGVLKDAYIASGMTDVNPYLIFIQTLPYRFYNFLILGFIILIAVMNKDFGPMFKAEQRARLLNKTHPNASHQISNEEISHKHKHIANALVPIFVLIFGAFFSIWYDGYRAIIAEGNSIQGLSWNDTILTILNSTDVMLAIFKASILASIVAMILSTVTKSIKFFDAIDTWIDGASRMLSTVIILVLAWTISSIIKEIGTSHYLIQLLQNSIPVFLIPIISFVLAAIITFATGTSFGTMGIFMPIAIPLAASLSGGADTLITTITAGTVLTGAIVGDHCSPISDTTILAAGGSDCPLIDHVDTQLPYALVVFVISLVLGYLPAVFNISPVISYILGLTTLGIIIALIGKRPDVQH